MLGLTCRNLYTGIDVIWVVRKAGNCNLMCSVETLCKTQSGRQQIGCIAIV